LEDLLRNLKINDGKENNHGDDEDDDEDDEEIKVPENKKK